MAHAHSRHAAGSTGFTRGGTGTGRFGLLSHRAWARLAVLITGLILCAVTAAEPQPKLPLPEAIKLLQSEAGVKDQASRDKVLPTFKDLTDAERAQLLPDLLPLLGEKMNGARREAVVAAFHASGKDALPPLADALTDDVKAGNAMAILPRFQVAAADALTGPLKHAEPKVRQRALKVLAAIAGSLTSLPPGLHERLTDTEAGPQREALRTVIACGPKAKDTRDTLMQLASGAPDVSVRVFAVRALGALGTEAAPAVTPLAALLAHPSLSLRAETLATLGKLGPLTAAAAPAVTKRLLDGKEDPYVRRVAAETLGKLGEPGLAALIGALNHADDEIASRAALALAAGGGTAVAPILKTLQGPDARARRFAAFALAKLGPVAKDAYDALAIAAADPEMAVRRNAIEALGRLGNDKALDLCVTALKDKAPEVARAAAGAIESLVKDAAQADTRLADYRKSVAWRPTAEPERNLALPPAELEKYEIGGPLAGLRLPLFKGQHGEQPGYPGCIPELITSGKTFVDMNNSYNDWGPQGTAPELELYPGAAEHYRNYMFKYYGARSFFDRQSQLKNWVAPALPGADKALAGEYAEPVYHVPRHAEPRPTGKTRAPVAVIRCRIHAPVFKLDLGDLDVGLYAVRVIGAVENRGPRRFLEPLFLRFRVNDGAAGDVQSYRIRCGYVDQFYSLAEFYFHALEKRRFTAEVEVDEGSKVELLVHNITLDDALVGTTRQAVKRQSVLVTAPARVSFKSKLLAEERLLQDADIWRAQPPLNAQGTGGYWPTLGSRTGGDAQADVVRFGADGLSEQEIAARYGTWQATGNSDAILVNHELGLRYTLSEYLAGKPLPDPYPYKDSGAGLYQPDPKDPNKGQVLAPIGDWVSAQRGAYGSPDRRPHADRWVKDGDSDAAREEAMRLIRIAWQCPAIDIANNLAAATCIPAAYGRDIRCRRRETYADWLSHYPNYIQPPMAYDKLFTYIDGNEELAASVSRFVPWVKNSRDLIKLLDVYLLQTIAKRVMRYHYATGPTEAGDAALLQDNRSLTEPWIDWLFSRTFVYPLRPAGLQNVMITGCDRSGPEYVGSAYYSQGEGAARAVESTEKFRRRGILPERYDLTRTDLYPKPLAHCYWQLAVNVAGQEFLRVGDVTGADKAPGHLLLGVPAAAVNGWNWSHDPRFAWVLKNVNGRKDQSDADWQAIAAAAALVSRAPWLTQPSRQVYNWAGILESGQQHDDWRFHRAVYVRTGLGMGHQHSDSLDLQVVAHGLPMTMDGGQRGGYSTPGSATTRVHNLVEVNGKGHYTQSWVRTLADAAGARYMEISAEPPNGTKLFRRQVALVDVDEGTGSQPLSLEQQKIRAKLPADVVTANSYVFDVFRVSGGQTHTYCFHGPVSDELVVNDLARQAVVPAKEGTEPNADQQYLRVFDAAKDTWFAGDAPALLSATWRYSRQGTGAESAMAAPNFVEASPRKYTRLHLFDTAGLRVLQGAYNCHNNGYRLHNVFAQRRAADGELESAFAALIEPYAGEPFITERKSLTVDGNEADARRAVAVEVKTRNGHTDVLFADGRPDKTRTVGAVTVAGEYACYATDAQGLRLATLAGGTLLAGPELRLKTAAREYTGTVTAVNYLKKAITLDAAWPVQLAGRVCEIGTANRTTSYTLVAAAPQAGGSVLTVDGGADHYQAVIENADEATGVVTCTIKTALGKLPGLDRDFTASNEQMTKWWRADYLDEMQWKLSGAPVKTADFQPSRFLRVWEYGVGDRMRISTDAAVRRVADGVYEVTGSVELTLALKAKGMESTADQKNWTAMEGRRDGDWYEVAIRPGKAVFVRCR